MSDIVYPIIITIIGWIIVHYLSEKRDRKKEWREFSRDTAKFIEVIEDRSISYHTGNSRDINLESRIKSDIEYLDSRLSLIKRKLKFDSEVSFFRASITLYNFETCTFNTQCQNSELIRDIYWNANILKNALYKAE